MTDHPTREDFAWSGVEQLSRVPEGADHECPICKMPFVSGSQPTTLEPVPFHNPPLMRDDGSLTTTEITNGTPNINTSTVHIAGTTVTSNGKNNTEKSRETTIAVFVGDNNLPDCALVKRIEDTPFIRIRRCGHIYHTSCLRAWIGEPQNKTCPMCRRVLFEKSCNHSRLDESFARLREDINWGIRGQGAVITRLTAENATLKQQKIAAEKEVQELKQSTENIRKGYADFVSDCMLMCFVALMVVLAVYAWWKS
jgi:hypothetical protein